MSKSTIRDMQYLLRNAFRQKFMKKIWKTENCFERTKYCFFRYNPLIPMPE